MKIEQFAAKPKLIEVTLDDKDILENYGEPITFYTYDIVNMSVYFDFFNARTTGEYEKLTSVIKTLILNEKGKPVLDENNDLPMDILSTAILKIGENLGKSQGKKSTQKPGVPLKS
jgi:hypothetical protein